MKKLMSLMLCCVLLMSLTAAFAEDVAVLTLHGYEIGKSVEDISVTENSDWLDIVMFDGAKWLIAEEVGNNLQAATGTFQAGKQYVLFVLTGQEGFVPDESQTPSPFPLTEEEERQLLAMVELSNGSIKENVAAYTNGVVTFTFVLKPLQAIPATGDGANLALWTAMLAFSAVGMIALSRKAKYSR